MIGRLVRSWRRRRWRADPAALSQFEGMQPAVVVTGASRGIGLALARRFASRGCTVVLVARNADRLASAAAAIAGDFGVSVVPLAMDATTPDAPSRIEAELASRRLYADVLVNNAGLGLGGNYLSHDPAKIAALLDLNVRALALLMRHFLPGMLIRGEGGILNVASLGAYTPGPYQAAYYASKAFVLSLTEAVAWESRGLGVRIAVFAPGPVRTGFHASMGAEYAFYRWLLPSLSADRAAASAMRGYHWGRTVITPGLAGPLAAWLMRLTPHPILVPILAWLLKPRGFWRNVGRDDSER
jgi:short-subunit dehydrogenase